MHKAVELRSGWDIGELEKEGWYEGGVELDSFAEQSTEPHFSA